jgi:hypothetical protein
MVSIVPLLLAVVAGQEEEQRATHENRLHSPPCSCPFLNEEIQLETSQPVFFWMAVNAVIGHCFSLFERLRPCPL